MSLRPPPRQIPRELLQDPQVAQFFLDIIDSLFYLWANVEQNVGFYGKDPVAQASALTAALTTITHTAPGTADYAIQNLTNSSPYGFVSQDEGNSVLAVIANLQARVNELEAALDSSTGIGVIE